MNRTQNLLLALCLWSFVMGLPTLAALTSSGCVLLALVDLGRATTACPVCRRKTKSS